MKRILFRPILWLSLAILLIFGWYGTHLAIGAVIEEEDQVLLLSKHGNLIIIENQGQYDDRAGFVIRHGAGITWLADDSIWLTLYDDPQFTSLGESKSTQPEDEIITGVNIKLSFPEFQNQSTLQAAYRQPTHISYLIGQDAEQWNTNVPVWGEVRYSGLSPGVDLVFDGSDPSSTGAILPWRLEANDQQDLLEIALRIEGADRVNVAKDGLSIEVGDQSYAIPLFKSAAHRSADRADLLSDVKAISIDRQAPRDFLVTIPLSPASGEEPVAPEDDPNDLIFSTYLGGSSWDSAYGVAIDDLGHPYVIGSTPSSDFPTTPGAFDETLSVIDAFVTKFTTDGTGLVYSTFIGGSHTEKGLGIDVENGVAYITGETRSVDFPLNTELEGESDIYVVALNSDGTDLNYSTLIGGRYEDTGNAIDVEGGVAAVTGVTWSNNFPGVGDNKLDDAFVLRLNPSGELYIYNRKYRFARFSGRWI